MTTATSATRPPLPPFTRESAIQKVRTRRRQLERSRPGESSSGITRSIHGWRNRAESSTDGTKSLLSYLENGPKVRLPAYQRTVGVYWESYRRTLRLRVARRLGSLYRSYGNENWEFNDDGLHGVTVCEYQRPSIPESDRKYHWPLGRSPGSIQD